LHHRILTAFAGTKRSNSLDQTCRICGGHDELSRLLQELFPDEITVPLHPEPLNLFRVNLLQESSGCLRDSYILPGTGDWIGNFDEISIY
jgi:hypothetical protein